MLGSSLSTTLLSKHCILPRAEEMMSASETALHMFFSLGTLISQPLLLPSHIYFVFYKEEVEVEEQAVK